MTDPTALHDVLYDIVRAEINDSLAFITGSRVLPRGQRHPRVGPSVRDYLADHIAWKFLGLLDGGVDEIKAQIERDAMTGCCAKDGIDCVSCMTGRCNECLDCVHGPSHDDSARDEGDVFYDPDED